MHIKIVILLGEFFYFVWLILLICQQRFSFNGFNVFYFFHNNVFYSWGQRFFYIYESNLTLMKCRQGHHAPDSSGALIYHSVSFSLCYGCPLHKNSFWLNAMYSIGLSYLRFTKQTIPSDSTNESTQSSDHISFLSTLAICKPDLCFFVWFPIYLQ